jgi:two-component system, NtrC family, nitrogen regulation response regulator GlnG
LLRAIREGEIQPVGEARARKANVRVLSATDADLEAMVERGQFAMPLLRRLEGYTIAVPPLRRRRDDLARLFVRALRRELEATGELFKLDEPQPSHKPWLPAALVADLLDYDWPGNVAELETIAKRLAITNRQRPEFYLDPLIVERLVQRPAGASPAERAASGVAPSERSPAVRPARLRSGEVGSLDDGAIVRVMREHRFQINAAAVALGVSRSWLHKRLERCSGVRQAKELAREEILAALREPGADLSAVAERLEVSEHGLKLRMKALDIPTER